MAKDLTIPAPRQRATLRLSAGRALRLRASVEVSSVGLLAIGGLVSSILLSTAVLIGVATRRHSPPFPP